MGKSEFTGLDPHQVQFIKLINENSRRHRRHEVFIDFCEISAISISNAVDPLQYDAREARYMEIVGRYEKPEVERFAAMFAEVVMSLENDRKDSLGQIFMSMGLGDHWKGQFFTPDSIAALMARMTLEGIAAVIDKKGFITLNEPAAGAGAMIIATADALLEQGINYQQAMHVTTTDLDSTACHMAYIQFSLLHIPAIVIHGNALNPAKTWGHWVTPAHVMGLWDYRLCRDGQKEEEHRAPAVKAEVSSVQLDKPIPLGQQSLEIAIQRIKTGEQLDLFA